MPDFGSCSANLNEIADSQYCQGFGGCGADGLAVTSGNLNGVLARIQAAITAVVTSLSNYVTTTALTDTLADYVTEAELVRLVSGVPLRCPIAWYPASGSDPVPTGFFVCDGTNGTPDLRDRFIVSSGTTFADGGIGGSLEHDHGGAAGETVLTEAMTPPHTHNMVAAGLSNDPLTATTALSQERSAGNDTEYILMGGAGAATLGLTSEPIGVTTSGHSHTIDVDSNLPPYFAMKYIMRV